MDISHLLSLPEGKTLEFKRDLSSSKSVLRTLVAFANTAGGTLIIGKADDGKIVGVDDVLAEEERLANLISDNIAPAMMPEIEAITVEDKTLLLVRVAHWPGPFYLKESGARMACMCGRVPPTARRMRRCWQIWSAFAAITRSISCLVLRPEKRRWMMP